jgi:hypothetical protein
VDTLLNLEGTDRFGGVGGFVNVSRHRDNLLVNGLGAFLFGKRKIIRRRITLGNGRLICRLISQGSICNPGSKIRHGINTHVIAKRRTLPCAPSNDEAPLCAFSAFRGDGQNSAARHLPTDFRRRARLKPISSRQRAVIGLITAESDLDFPDGDSSAPLLHCCR